MTAGAALGAWLRKAAARVLLASACAWLAGGCLFYDSRWGQAKASQKRVAAQNMPSQLRSAEDAGESGTDVPREPVRELQVRAYATPRYASALVDGEAQFRQALADANPTLTHDLSIRLSLSQYAVWSHVRNDDDLAQLLSQIQSEDPGEDVAWVVVLASPREMVATSADQLGMGQYLGRHLALRAMSDAAEFDLIQKAYTELSDEEKKRLYGARKQHKAAAVLLHEVGHTLGLPHELERSSMMSAIYSSDAAAFSAHAVRLARRGLELRETTLGTDLHRNAAQAALNVLQAAPAHTWEESSVAQLRQLLQQHARPSASAQVPAHLAPKVAATPRQPVKAAAPQPQLSGADKALFDRARQEQAAQRIAEARALAASLFEKYPDDYAVQELRCQLAMKAALPMGVESAECAPLRKLSGSSF